MEVFKLEAQVLGVPRSVRAIIDGLGYAVETLDGRFAARTLARAIASARDDLGPFLHSADRRGASWGLYVGVGQAAAVYGDWPLLPTRQPPTVQRETLVSRIRRQWRGNSAVSALVNAIEIIHAHARGRAAA